MGRGGSELKDLRDAIPEPVLEVCRALEARGHRAWVVGGCIRDLLRREPVSDWDLATSALPDEVQKTFSRTIPTGIEHGTVTVLHRGEAYEVTTLRGEGAYTDGRRPDQVELGVDIDEDLARRDFTVNAIAYDPLTHETVDPWGGVADLEARLIRAVGDPRERFGEDGLRVLRAARFAATLGFELHEGTRAAIPGSLDTFRKVSPERIRDEWRKAFLHSDSPSRAFRVMRETGILGVTCEPMAALSDAVFDATMDRVDRASRDPEIRLAALLLDLRETDAWVESWLREMRTSNQERKRVLHLRAHARPDPSSMLSDPALRAWLAAVGRDELPRVLELARADGRDVDALAVRARSELAAGTPLTTRELSVDGEDVKRVLGISPSRVIGDVLERLLARVHQEPSLAERGRLLRAIPEAYVDVTR